MEVANESQDIASSSLSSNEQPSDTILDAEIVDILKSSDLATITLKILIAQLEQKFGCDLSGKKSVIKTMMMMAADAITKANEDEDEDDEIDGLEEADANGDAGDDEDEDEENESRSKRKRGVHRTRCLLCNLRLNNCLAKNLILRKTQTVADHFCNFLSIETRMLSS